ncbi:hypothetical protein [Chryseobacterium sp. MMS23-Vi53]|uniref:hypothetical protein n=1 Tax=Chryseobacterium sp. MMS23-Vi53 TaxID=3386644 RepID=UPI0039E74AF6
MKNWIFCALFLSVLGCKKENTTSASQPKDSAKVFVKNIKADSSAAPQQIKEEIFNFETELCNNKGHFDANKYSKEELEGTFKLWFHMRGTMLSSPSVFNLNSLQKVRTEKDKILSQLDKDFSETKKILENLKVVKDPYWENLRTNKLQELKDEYELKKTEILAFSDPSILMNHKLSKGCENYAKALNSNNAYMVETWRKLREEMSKRNSDPQRIMSEFESHLNSSDKNDYATIDLITFGWGNCVNDKIGKDAADENMYKKFESLFIKIDSECDEP